MDDTDFPAVVLRGEASDGLRWTITAAGDDQDFSTMLNIYRDDKLVSGSGMGGPKLYGLDVMKCAYGHSDDLPFYEMVRVDASVDQVVATTSAGTEIVLARLGCTPSSGCASARLCFPRVKSQVSFGPRLVTEQCRSSRIAWTGNAALVGPKTSSVGDPLASDARSSIQERRAVVASDALSMSDPLPTRQDTVNAVMC